MSSKKIGVLGGSFSPVHNGHIFLAKYVKENCGLDKVLMIPTGVHPFECKRNKNIPDAEHRLNMLKLAVEGENGIEISDRRYLQRSIHTLQKSNTKLKIMQIIHKPSKE